MTTIVSKVKRQLLTIWKDGKAMRGSWAVVRRTALVAACSLASLQVTAGAASAATKRFRIGKSYREVFVYPQDGERWHPGSVGAPRPPREGWELTSDGPTLHVELEYSFFDCSRVALWFQNPGSPTHFSINISNERVSRAGYSSCNPPTRPRPIPTPAHA